MANTMGPVMPKAQRERGGKGNNDLQCSYCHQLSDHYTDACPQRAADTRGHDVACRARATQTGSRCELCGQPGHERRHHLFALQDHAAKQTQGGKGGGKKGAESGTGKNTNKDGKSPTKAAACPADKTQCKWGNRCHGVLWDGKCNDWYPK